MRNAVLTWAGCLFFVLLCIFSYAPLNTRFSQPDFLALSYGPAVHALLPLFLVMVAAVGSLTMLYVSAKMSTGEWV